MGFAGVGKGEAPLKQAYIAAKQKLAPQHCFTRPASAACQYFAIQDEVYFMTSKYLTGADLNAKIRKTLQQPNPRMCVAFLGHDWVSALFSGKPPADLKVICDLEMGVTTKQALSNFNAPNNKRLRHLPDVELHAKVYLSDEGAVVCSANASQSALNNSKRIEDGVWFSSDDPSHEKIANEFASRWQEPKKIGKKELKKAPLFIPKGSDSPSESSPKTLLELLKSNPAALHGIRFVFSNSENDRDVEDSAFDMAKKQAVLNEDFDAPNLTKKGCSFFTKWERPEKKWPILFIHVHRGERGGIYLSKHQRLFYFASVKATKNVRPVDVCVTRKVPWRTNGVSFGDSPELASETQCKNEIKEFFEQEDSFDGFAGEILTAEEFASRLSTCVI